eukprot:gene2526-721_t
MNKGLALSKELQQARWDERWGDMKDIFNAWASKFPVVTDDVTILKHFVNGESTVELYITENKDKSRVVTDFLKEKPLNEAVDELRKSLHLYKEIYRQLQGPVMVELLLLLCKCYFIANQFEESLKFIDESGVTQNNVEDLSKRGHLLAAQALCYKGVMLAKTRPGSENEVLAAYKFSADISLWLYCDENRTGSLKKSLEMPRIKVLPRDLVQSFVKPVEIELRQGNVYEAISYYRSFLRVVESRGTTPLRKILALNLADILLFGQCEGNYNRPPIHMWQNETRTKSGSLTLKTYQERTLSSSSSGRSTPKVSHKDYGRSNSAAGKDGAFCPKDEFEEAILVLLLSEALLLRDGCVSLFDKDRVTREQTIAEARSVYDLLCIATARRKQYGFLLECLERGMKLSYQEFSLWFQYGLALICDQRYKKALVVLKRCHELQPDNQDVVLYCIKVCINNLHQFDNAIDFANKGLGMANEPSAKSLFHFAIGICYSALASKASCNDQEKVLRRKSKEALERAMDLDPNDADVMCQLALNHAISKELAVAANLVNQALQVDPYHRDSLLLLSLILSAQSRSQDSLEIIDVVIREFPDDFLLLQVKVFLTEECFGGEQALALCQEMLRLWDDLFGEEIGDDIAAQQGRDAKSGKSSVLKKPAADTRSVDGVSVAKSAKSLAFADGIKQCHDEDEVGSITESVTIERSLSEIASTTVSGAKLRGPAAIAILAKIWLITADVYLNMGNTNEASNCVLEASSIFPVSPEVLSMRGRLNYMQRNFEEAKACFESAMAVAPKYVEAMEKLAILHHENGSASMAQKYIRDAISLDPMKPSLWQVFFLKRAFLWHSLI